MSSNGFSQNLRIALVHDWLLGMGGAEKTLKTLHDIFPQAPVYTLFHNKSFTDKFLPQTDIRTSFLQKPYRWLGGHKLLTPFMPMAIESIDFSEFDLVISSSVAFSKGLILKPRTKHICYCHSPTRQLWDWQAEYKREGRFLPELLVSLTQHFLRIWDRHASTRADEFIAISENVRRRIKKYYGRDSIIIYPPITKPETVINQPELDLGISPKTEGDGFKTLFAAKSLIFERDKEDEQNARKRSSSYGEDILRNLTQSQSEIKDCSGNGVLKPSHRFFLIVSRLYKHKNVEVAVRAFNKLEWPLVVIGEGPEFKRLKKIAGPTVKLLGYQPDGAVGEYYANCAAFIMPQEEDFGITPIEAMSCGKPVLALARGGALEYVQEGVNGELFEEPTEEILADGVRRLKEGIETGRYNPEETQKTAKRFSEERFKNEVTEFLKTIL